MKRILNFFYFDVSVLFYVVLKYFSSPVRIYIFIYKVNIFNKPFIKH